jgi:penicillin amidase
MVVRDGGRRPADRRGALPVGAVAAGGGAREGLPRLRHLAAHRTRQPRDYWGGSYDPWRALRINALLRADSAVTPTRCAATRPTPGSERANLFVPYFLAAAERVRRTHLPGRARPMDEGALARAATLLGAWDRRYTRENTGAVLFEAAMRQLVERTWDELLAPPRAAGAPAGQPADTVRRRVATPSSAVLLQLLRDSASLWWDVVATPGVHEDRDEILAASLVAALASTVRERGEPEAGGWAWSPRAPREHRPPAPPARPRRAELAVQGGPGTLSPSSGSGGFGASWRMVVELGPQLTAWATYPGGQSGNPASTRYADRVPTWQAGRLDSLVVPRTAAEAGQGRSVLTLTPGRK